MKIISKGNKNVECNRCGCIMEFDSKDIHKRIVQVSDSVWFSSLTKPVEHEYIECPQCGKEIIVGATNLREKYR